MASWGQSFWQRGWLPAGAGNFSWRVAPDEMLITASGRHKGRLGPADFLRLPVAGEDASGASAETALHRERYQSDPAIGCVLHTHSVFATLMSRRVGDVVELADYELAKAFSGIDTHAVTLRFAVFDNDQNVPRLAAAVAARHARDPVDQAYLIRGHGLYAWGPDVESAARRIEAAEFLLECAFRESQR